MPAKLNVVLSVGPRRADGFHDLATLFHAVSLYDTVDAAPADELSVTMQGPYGAHVGVDRNNLAVRAARALAAHAGVSPAARLSVRKDIPVAAGLAGGSADAAGVLLACDALWQLGLPGDELAAIAATLGSDVPFALTGGSAVGTGRGDILRAVPAAAMHWVLAVADGGLSTPEVYRRLDALREDDPEDSVAPPDVGAGALAALAAGDAEALGRVLHNDLQDAALELRPELRRALRAGDALGLVGSIVSGSGPTVAFLARDAAHAAEAAAGLGVLEVCADAVAATGPARTEISARAT